MKPNQKILLACGAAVIVIVGILLWFNRYSFSEMKLGDNTFPIRTSRFSGEAEVFVMGKWTQMGGASSNTSSSEKPIILGQDDLRKIDGRAGIQPQTWVVASETPKVFLSCSVYNGTSYRLTDLTIRIEIKQTDTQKGLTRDYRLRPKNGSVVPSLSNGDFEADLGLPVPEQGKWSWGIVGASGVQ